MNALILFARCADGRPSFMDWSDDDRFKPAALDAVYVIESLPAGLEPLAAAEVVYSICNSYPDELHCDARFASEVEAYREVSLRSLSCGDAVAIDGRVYVVASFGFREVSLDELDALGIQLDRSALLTHA